MGALNPIFLIAGLVIGVPIFLHLFQRHQTRRLSFPALRYLERTEREHAKQIRFRQLLLLLTRVAVLVLIVGAGARLVFLGRGSSHPPTATVIVLDNSMSSGLVVGETRVLDELKDLARQTLDGASAEDRFWVIRAGEPWLPAIPGDAAETRVAVERTEASAAAGDLAAALERAVELLETSELVAREIHLLSDMQRTAFTLPGTAPSRGLPVVAWTGTESNTVNRALTRVVIGGGLPPLQGQRTEVTVTAFGAGGDTARIPVRVLLNERIRAAATLPAGAETSIGLPATGSGWVQGYADADPDALRADDRRYFAYRSRPAPTVSVGGAPGIFVAQALAVLEAAGRLRTTGAQTADILIAQNGSELERRGASSAALVIPPADPTLLPALNRRLAEAGIPWRYDLRVGGGGTELAGPSVPEPLLGVQVREWFDMVPVGDPQAPTRTLAEVGGRPWALDGTDREGRRYLLLASSMEPSATTLPISTAMLRFVDWAISEWAGGGGVAAELTAGTHLPAPVGATHIRFPSGAEHEIDGTRTVRGTGEAGFYTFLAGDTTVSIVALNSPARESRLAPLDGEDYRVAIGPEVIEVDRKDAWSRAVFRSRQGPELWWPLLLGAIALLVIESLIATSGRGEGHAARRRNASASESDARA